jgi:hypothetical protein
MALVTDTHTKTEKPRWLGTGFSLRKNAFHEGHGFCRAVNSSDIDGLAAEVRLFVAVSRQLSARDEKSVPQGLKPSSIQSLYGTVEAVPFVHNSC